MSHTMCIVRTVKGDQAQFWSGLLRARNFVVPPSRFLRVRLEDEELKEGATVAASLGCGPIVLPDPWIVETHRRDDGRVRLSGAEGFEGRLLWDYDILIGEFARRFVVEYRVRMPSPMGRIAAPLGLARMIERRHGALCAAAAQASRPRIVARAGEPAAIGVSCPA